VLVTPFKRTSGRPLDVAVSLLVAFTGYVLKWQEPASAAAETIYRLMAGFKKFLLLSERSFSGR
jgi:hypothetical protein